MELHRMNTGLFQKFFNSEKAGGLILICCTVISTILANSNIGDAYIHFWHTDLPLNIGFIHIPFRIEEWINDGLMSIFFLLVGLEIERELYIGEISSAQKAILPVMAAVGGMILPAIIHFIFNRGTSEQHGFGIPMATDIAFSLGVLSLLGKRVPLSLKIFLTALAIIDDLGAIVIIAIFYTSKFSLLYLSLAILIVLILAFFNKKNVFTLWLYFPAGIIIWYLLFLSGVHPTLSGVLLAFVIPFRKNMEKAPSELLQHALHKPINFIIIPLFALANTAITLPVTWTSDIFSHNSLGIIFGLILGKPLGVVAFTMLAVWMGLAKLPDELNLPKLIGVGILAGIGFTMSIFISNLAFGAHEDVTQSSKVAILFASFLAAGAGWLLLKRNLKS